MRAAQYIGCSRLGFPLFNLYSNDGNDGPSASTLRGRDAVWLEALSTAFSIPSSSDTTAISAPSVELKSVKVLLECTKTDPKQPKTLAPTDSEEISDNGSASNEFDEPPDFAPTANVMCTSNFDVYSAHLSEEVLRMKKSHRFSQDQVIHPSQFRKICYLQQKGDPMLFPRNENDHGSLEFHPQSFRGVFWGFNSTFFDKVHRRLRNEAQELWGNSRTYDIWRYRETVALLALPFTDGGQAEEVKTDARKSANGRLLAPPNSLVWSSDVSIFS